MEFKTKPYEHQLQAFERFKDSPYFALFMDMGTGKTKVSIDIAAHKFETKQINAVLIIAPNNVHTQWIREQFPLHCPIPYRPFVWESGKVGRSYYTTLLRNFSIENIPFMKVLAVNVEAFQSDTIVPYIADYVKCNKCFIIIDEATRIKNSDAKRTKVIHKLEKYGQRAILTGTPTAKSPFDLWSQMQFLKANYFDCNYFIFQHRYGILVKGVNTQTGKKFNSLIDEKTYAIVSSHIKRIKESRGGKLMPDDYETIAALHETSEKNVRFIETNPAFTRFKRLDELRAYIAKDVFAVRKEDCLDLPPKIYERILVNMTPEQARVYKNLKEELMATYGDKELTVANKVALTTRLMQILGGFFPYMKEVTRYNMQGPYTDYEGAGELIGSTNAKMEAIKADLEEVAEGTKIIIWAHFVAELKYIYNELKKNYRCCLYYGATSDYERKKIVEDFKRGEYDIFIGNTATAGFGLNLQNASLQYYFSNSFRTEDRLQAEDRSHRIGMKSTAVYKDIIVKGTVDEKIYANITAGRNLNDYFKAVSLKDLFEDIPDANDEEGR